MPIRTLKLIIGLLGLTGVALGAFGAHALKAQLMASGHAETWGTAVLYHLIHTVAILAVAMGFGDPAQAVKSRFLAVAAICWVAGIILFSGSLYVLSVGGPHWLGPVTPVGGLALLIGWGCVAANALSSPTPPGNK